MNDGSQLDSISKEHSIITLLALFPLHVAAVISDRHVAAPENRITTRVLAAIVTGHESCQEKGHGDEGDEDSMSFDESVYRLSQRRENR